MDIYADYLRKSRSDEQAEARGEGDVLARHRKTLQELAAYNGHMLVAEYAEVASGDSLAARPEAQRLLLDVMAGKYTGVYCMALDRLSRGAAEDQAAVIRAFQASGTLLITPEKVYDFTNAADEDFGELRLMFSRIEHKTIKRRMYAGRERSARDGWYIGARIPFGYAKVPAQGKDGPTLKIIPEQAELIRATFEAYADGKSSHAITDMLNAQPVKPNYSDTWTPSTIRNILRNPLYIGKISWGKRISRPAPDGSAHRVVNSRAILADGRHEPIITQAMWDAVQARLERNPAPTISEGLQNPLQGLVRCGLCGCLMQRSPAQKSPSGRSQPAILKCPTHGCKQIRSDLAVIEDMILQSMDACYGHEGELSPVQIQQRKDRQKAAKLILDQIKQAEAQQSRQADLLEQGVYTVEDFVSRRNALSERLRELHRRYDEATAPDLMDQAYEAWRQIVPRSSTVSEAYRRAPDNATKNALLKALIRSITYNKTQRRAGKNADKQTGITLEYDLIFQ